MDRYIFILGNNPELSTAEITAVLPDAKILTSDRKFLVLENKKLNCFELISRLGGTIKIGVVLGTRPDFGPILGAANSSAVKGKFKFGVSFYEVKKNNFGMKAKTILKERGISSRLVEGREDALSSVIVTKEKCRDFIVLPEYFGLTLAVQDFHDYSIRDFGRPASDALSGMLPPKLAKMMINLSGAKINDTILDPFCGSGTILSEAAALDFTNLIGCDVSAKAVNDTKENLEWLKNKFKIQNSKFKIFNCDVIRLSEKVEQKSIDAIVTEPYLGPPIKGNEKEATIKKIVESVENLYLDAFKEFKKTLKPDGCVVMVFPEWHFADKIFRPDIFSTVKKIGFKRLDNNNLIYKREKQKVWRQIVIFKM